MKIALTGSSGLIGKELITYAQANGHEVIRLIRRRGKGADERQWNPDRGDLSPSALEGADVVIHLAGENIAGRWTDAKKKAIRDSRVKSTTLLAKTISSMSQPPKALICASAIGFYGDRGDEILTEASPAGTGYLADVCKEWEQSADACRDKTRVAHMRLGIVLSTQGGALSQMYWPFFFGGGGIIGSGSQYWSWVTLADAAKSFLFAATDADVEGPANVVAPNPVTNKEFTKALGKVMKRPTLIPMPAAAARLALGEMADGLILSSARVVPERLRQEGFQFGQVEILPALRSVLER